MRSGESVLRAHGATPTSSQPSGTRNEPYRADEIEEPGDTPEQIFDALRDEDVVIADLTGAHPNVMYELGIRHVLGKCTIQIGEKGRLPFDIATIRTIQFLRTPNGLIRAKKALTKMIASSLANGCKPSTVARVLKEGTGVVNGLFGNERGLSIPGA